MNYSKSTLFIILINITFSVGFGQDKPLRKFGEISDEEMNLQYYPKDKNAEAVVLFDIGKSIFFRYNNTYDLIFTKHTRIKIFSAAGLSYANVEIPYYQDNTQVEEVRDIDAVTYNFVDGKLNVTSMSSKNCFDEKLNDHWRVKKFAIPDVREGSIIEFRYKIITPFKFNLRDWEFQTGIPTIYSEYEARMIPFYEYTYLLQGASQFDEQVSYVDKGPTHQFGPMEFQDMVYKYIMKDVPAFKDEEFISTVSDYIIKLDFQLSKKHYPNGATINVLTTWPELNNELLKDEYFGRYMDKCEKEADKLIDLSTPSFQNKTEEAEYLINYVKSNFSWNGVTDKFAHKSLKDFLTQKTGNTGNINLFLAGVLKAKGFEAYPVILSTRENGKIKIDYPFHQFFNYVVVIFKVNESYMITDASEVLCPFDKVPIRCLNGLGLIVNKNSSDWVPMANNSSSSITENIFISPMPSEESLECNLNLNYQGYSALEFRNRFNNKIESVEEYLLEKGFQNLDSLHTNNFFENRKDYIVGFKTAIPAEIINEKIYVKPFLDEPPSENPLKQPQRTYPIDFIFARKQVYNAVISIPEGYKISFKPENLSIATNLIMISYSSAIKDNALRVTGIYEFKNPVYNPEDYNKLKYYYNAIIKKFNDKIVFEKITD